MHWVSEIENGEWRGEERREKEEKERNGRAHDS